MSIRLRYSKQRAKAQISGAIPFRYQSTKLVKKSRFPEKTVSRASLRDLCVELDPISVSVKSPLSLLLDREISLGQKRYIEEEFQRVMELSSVKNKQGFLLGFPFKCPVPFKTNHHNAPDLGEAMFFHRLGKICRILSEASGEKYRITILEETQALAPVFDIDSKHAAIFEERLHGLLVLLRLKQYITIRPLSSFLAKTSAEYKRRLLYLANEAKNKKIYEALLKQVLPTIALSVNINRLSLTKSQKYIADLFDQSVSTNKDLLLFETAYKYIAFTLLQKESNFREKHFSDYLQFSLCPKKGRISIYPTIKSARVWPHHGVPIVYVINGRKTFLIEYFADFVKQFKNKDIIKVVDQDNNFLYYQVQ